MKPSTLKKTVLSVALAASIGASAVASADTILNFSYTGLFTMLDSTGKFVRNTSTPFYSNTYSGNRSAISGTMSFDLNTGTGSGTMVPFNFFNQTLPPPATAYNVSFQAIGNGTGCTTTGCNPGSLVLGNMLFDWNGNIGIPVSIVLDASGMFAYAQGGVYNVSDTITGASPGGVLPASNSTKTSLQIGLVPIATTTWNTTSTCTAILGTDGKPTGNCMGVNPSGVLPLIANTIGGTPMIDGPFYGFNANFDIQTLHLDSVQSTTVVPVPAAVWLFGSGLLGLVGIARRKKKA